MTIQDTLDVLISRYRGMRRAQTSVLTLLLVASEAVTASEVCDSLEMSPGTVYPLIQRLAEDGFVEGDVRMNGQARVTYWGLTERGREWAEGATRAAVLRESIPARRPRGQRQGVTPITT
jgi:DNA-binding MarR family transcriptional regulator